MKKYSIYLFIFAVIQGTHTIVSCPCEFSPKDRRPFFEQYEDEVTILPDEEQE